MDKETRSNIMLFTTDTLQTEEEIQDEIEGWKKEYHAKSLHMIAIVAILISDKIAFKTKRLPAMMKGSVHQEKNKSEVVGTK